MAKFLQESHHDLSFMMHDLAEQYRFLLRKETLEAPDVTGDDIKIAMSSLLLSGTCRAWDIPNVLGCAYCTATNGIAEWKPAHT